MSALKLSEFTADLIEAQIKDNIAAALADVRTDRNDSLVNLTPPKEYWQFEKAKGYRAPAIFTIMESMEGRQEAKQSNFIAALARVTVAVVLEDKNRTILTRMAYRYQAALMKLLEHVTLTSLDGKVRLFLRVGTVNFSASITDASDETSPAAVFRKEVSLSLNVEHYESL